MAITKMSKWIIKENSPTEYLIQTTPLEKYLLKNIYSNNGIEFKLSYNKFNRHEGYILNCPADTLGVKYDFNNIAVILSKEDEKTPRDLEILYEDQVIRLLAFELKRKKEKIRDYLLVGRWRTDNSEG